MTPEHDTTTTTTNARKARKAGRRTGGTGSRGGLTGAVAAEWTKLWGVRSTWVCLAATAALLITYTVIAGVSARSAPDSGTALPTAPLDNVATGAVFMGQFAVLALAAMVIATEYATGGIRTTLQWVPIRHRMLLSKSLVLFPVLFVTGLLLTPLALAAAVASLGAAADPVTAGAVVGRTLAVGGYLGAVGVIVIGIGTALRSVAGTVTVGFLVLLVLPMTLQTLSVEFLARTADYLPGPAGMTLMGIAESDAYGTTGAVALLCFWALAANAVGYGVLRTRDA
ncbi:ABC transporter permease [Streptomyces uncialis]|uniref:ABC transporter permease n=2 Tax=Streptomyces uncialis TaxID=1048205 RepID=UPI003791BA18